MKAGQSESPAELKAGILKESGTELADIPLSAALNPAPSHAEEKEKRDPGDEDPSRDIPSAEVTVTFDGQSNGGSADLGPFLEQRIGEIAKRIAEEEEQKS